MNVSTTNYCRTGSGPSIRAWAVPATGVKPRVSVGPAPDDHCAAGPDGSVIIPAGWGISRAGRRPTIRVGIVSPASVKVTPPPDDHFSASPNGSVFGAWGRRI